MRKRRQARWEGGLFERKHQQIRQSFGKSFISQTLRKNLRLGCGLGFLMCDFFKDGSCLQASKCNRPLIDQHPQSCLVPLPPTSPPVLTLKCTSNNSVTPWCQLRLQFHSHPTDSITSRKIKCKLFSVSFETLQNLVPGHIVYLIFCKPAPFSCSPAHWTHCPTILCRVRLWIAMRATRKDSGLATLAASILSTHPSSSVRVDA